MGNPEANTSAYESQTEYNELQPQEYDINQANNEAAMADNINYVDQPNYQNNDQQPQQQPPQPQPYQPQQMGNNAPLPQQQQQQPQYFQPPQQPMQYPPPPQQPHQTYPPPQQPMQYPPPAAAAYPPKPVQFPPTNQNMYQNVSPPVMQPQTLYGPRSPPPPQAFPQQPGYMPPASPHKPGGQPPTAVAGFPVGPRAAGDGWRSGLFDFMNDPMNALVTAFFPCLTFGQIAEIVDDGHTTCGTSGLLYGAIGFCIGMPCLMSCSYRTRLRNKFGLPEAPAPDWVTHFLCEPCALCQEYRELQLRGWDPSIGWHGNLARNQNMQPTPVMMAPMNQTMMS